MPVIMGLFVLFYAAISIALVTADSANSSICISKGNFVDLRGPYRYLGFNSTLNGNIYEYPRPTNGIIYLYPHILSTNYYYLISRTLYSSSVHSYCYVGTVHDLGDNYLFDIDDCQYWTYYDDTAGAFQISPDMEASTCQWSDVCVKNSMYLTYLNAYYQFMHWNYTTNGAVYYNAAINKYIYPHYTTTFAQYLIHETEGDSYANALCNIGEVEWYYNFDFSDCTQYKSWYQLAWTDEPDMLIEECTTSDPTIQPTTEPSLQPTVYPTLHPSVYPTAHPTHPTVYPTALPTVSPTQPTVNPTAHPTAQPTVYPTAHPTAQPTVYPTAHPTAQPTVNPTAHPTAQPTVYPTAHPTAQPTVYPTAHPTALTAAPTYYPSAFSTENTLFSSGATDGAIFSGIFSGNVMLYIGAAIVFIVLLIVLVLIVWCVCCGCGNSNVEGKENKATRQKRVGSDTVNIEMMNNAGMKIFVPMKHGQDPQSLASRLAMIPGSVYTPSSVTDGFEGVEETARI